MTELPQWMVEKASQAYQREETHNNEMTAALTAAGMREALACVEALRAMVTDPLRVEALKITARIDWDLLVAAREALAAFDATQENAG